MKDKLLKNNHKGIYYHTRKFFWAFLFSLTAVFALGLPTYVFIKNNQQRQSLAQEEKVEDKQNSQDTSLITEE